MNKKVLYTTAISVLLVFLVILISSCGDSGDYCIPPKAITGVCHTGCGSPAECHKAYTGDKGPDCKFGQVCDNKCNCVWVDKDLDGYPSKNLGEMNYTLDCDDDDPTVFPNAPEICDNKDNDCEKKSGNDIDESGVCNKNVFFCKTADFDTNSCKNGMWCSASTLTSSASCEYITNDNDVGTDDAYTFVCDNYFADGDYGCYKFVKGSFTVITSCNKDNVKDVTEECDGTDLGGLTCLDFGYIGGTLRCDHCTYDFNSCRGVVCNRNNIKETGEECDGTDLVGRNCQFFGFKGGNLSCNSACLFDTSGCGISMCGNNVVDLGEECDGTNLGARSCQDYGYVNGFLLCENDCSYDYSNCLNRVCDNNGAAESGEPCDGADFDGRTCQDFDFSGGTLGCRDDCEFDFSQCDNYVCDNDDVAEVGEACDASDLRSNDCKFFDMFKGGLLKCDSLCMFDTSECSLVCDNDDVAEVGEECDGIDLKGKTCNDLGRHGGFLACSPSCMFDLIDCGPACLEEWECTAWSNCSKMGDNTTRLCTDLKGCGTSYSKPVEVKPCDPSVCVDYDNDTYCVCLGGTLGCDCNDNNAGVQPNANELCNGKDDNCDALIDYGCPCEFNVTRTCGVNEGLCREGVQRCLNGYWGICLGNYIGPMPEVCDNGLDEDCDGYSDESCICEENATQECGTDVGECEKGSQTCFSSNWSACYGGKDKVPEICSGKKDEDCDTFVDCDDDSCLTNSLCDGSTPGTKPTCVDNKKNQGEQGVDCGGPCPACEELCGYGKIAKGCLCEGVVRTSGYCCSANKYKVDSCLDSCTDSDGDTLCDEDEIRDGTDPNNPDTDGDGIDDNEDDAPLCNKNGVCDSSREYPESADNCPDDCGEGVKNLGLLWWIIIILLVLIVGAIVFYLLAKKKTKKKKEEPRVVLSKPMIKAGTIQPITAAKKPMRDVSKLASYLDGSIKKGGSRLKLREAALKSGWSNEEINKAFETIDKTRKQSSKKFFSLFKK